MKKKKNTKIIIIDNFLNPAAAGKLLQSCLTLCNSIDGSPPGSPVPGILQAKTLEWVAISFSNAWKWKVKVKSLSLVQLVATPWTAAYWDSLSMGFSMQEYWSGAPLPSPSFISLYGKDSYTEWKTPRAHVYSCPSNYYHKGSLLWQIGTCLKPRKSNFPPGIWNLERRNTETINKSVSVSCSVVSDSVWPHGR